MDAAGIAVLGLLVVLLAFLGTSGAYLLRRSRIRRITSLRFLGMFYTSYAVLVLVQMFTEIGAGFPHIVFVISVQFVVYSGLYFVKNGFRLKFKHEFKLLLLMLTIEGVLNSIFALIRDASEYDDVGRLGITVFTNLQLVLVGTLQAFTALRDHSQLEHSYLPPHVTKRYLLFGLASTVVLAMALVDMVGTILNMLGLITLELSFFFVFLLSFVYCVLAFLAWVMPDAFKHFLDKNYTAHLPIVHDALASTPGVQLPDTAVQAAMTMSHSIEIVEYYGGILGGLIHESPGACKGLVLMAITTDLHIGEAVMLDKEKLILVFKGSLKRHLIQLGFQNTDEIIESLIADVQRNMSIFTVTLA
jgi:hypothetical protein